MFNIRYQIQHPRQRDLARGRHTSHGASHAGRCGESAQAGTDLARDRVSVPSVLQGHGQTLRGEWWWKKITRADRQHTGATLTGFHLLLAAGRWMGRPVASPAHARSWVPHEPEPVYARTGGRAVERCGGFQPRDPSNLDPGMLRAHDAQYRLATLVLDDFTFARVF